MTTLLQISLLISKFSGTSIVLIFCASNPLFTVNPSVFSGGEAVTIINNSGSAQTITQGSSMTLYWTSDGSSGNRTLGARGMATIWFAAHNISYISGSGLT